MRVLFMGTPDFAVPSLEMLLKKHEVVAVVTKPDRPKGRGNKLVSPVIKDLAVKIDIPVFQPERVKDSMFIEELKKFEIDVIVVVAFGQILPEEVLKFPRLGCINVHGSLLPKYRGAGPIQWAVIRGEKKTGVTTMLMSKGLDSGDMLLKKELDILDEDTYGSVHDKMSIIGAEALEETLLLLEQDRVFPEKQIEEEATFAPMITKETEKIDWSKPTKEILYLIRGLSPMPGASAYLNEELIKIWNGFDYKKEFNGVPGKIVDVTKKGFAVITGDGSLFITELQARGGKRMASDAYLRGHSFLHEAVFTNLFS